MSCLRQPSVSGTCTSEKLKRLLSTYVQSAVVALVMDCTLLHTVAFCLLLCLAAMPNMQQALVLYGGCV